jgi:hypothetical protein
MERAVPTKRIGTARVRRDNRVSFPLHILPPRDGHCPASAGAQYRVRLDHLLERDCPDRPVEFAATRPHLGCAPSSGRCCLLRETTEEAPHVKNDSFDHVSPFHLVKDLPLPVRWMCFIMKRWMKRSTALDLRLGL